MFIVRTMFWLSVVVLLLPADNTVTETNPVKVSSTAQVTTDDALHAAYSTVSDISTFCSRNPQVCDTGKHALNLMEAKAKYGVRVIYEWATAASGSDSVPESPITIHKNVDQSALIDPQLDPQSPVSTTGAFIVVAGGGSQNTLKIEDIIPEWSGPVSSARPA